MANTMFGAMSRVQPVNWGLLFHKFVEKTFPYIGRKPSFPYILHLYQHYDCFTAKEEDMLTIAADEVVYKLGPEAEAADTGTEDSSDPAVPEEPPVSPTPSFWKPTSPPLLPPHSDAGPSREAHWRDVDLSAWNFPEAPFKRIHDELAELQTQYYWMEHITRGTNMALDNCGPENILRELAKKADRKEIEQLRMEKAQLAVQVAAMTQELSQKSEEIWKYHAKQAVVFNQIRELVGHLGEIVNKAHLYDRIWFPPSRPFPSS